MTFTGRASFHPCRVLGLAFLILLLGSAASAQTIAWDPNTETSLAGYRVQYGTSSTSLTSTVDVGMATSHQFTGLQAGTTYYFRVVAYNSSGQVSPPSSQVSYTVPSTPPSTAPTLTSVSPTSGPTGGGTVITLTGTSFVSGATVRVGGVAASGVTFVSSTQVRATTPAGTAGARDVQITNPNGQAAVRIGAFTYTTTTGAPTLTSVSPTSGPTTGGTVITISGTNFVSGATVRVGGVAATGVTFVSATQVRATTPAGTAGARDVQVTNPNGQYVVRTGGFTYTTTSSLTLTAVSPTSGPTTGGTVITLTGTGFVSGARVSIGTLTAGNVIFVSSTQLRATTPAATAGARDVRVTNPNGQYAIRSGGFTYTTTTGAPTITGVSPTSGPTTGGTVITITGSNFVSGATVRVGGAAATGVTFLSATQVRATTPAGTAGARDVQVTNPNAQYAIRTGGFTYTTTTSGPAPTFSLITPSSGPTTGGTAVTLTGGNFVAGATVRFGGVLATNVTVQSSSRIQATTPPGSAGTREVRITNPNGGTVAYNVFTYVSSSTSSGATTAAAGTFSSFLAEGAQTGQMSTQLAIANAEETDAQVNLTFMDAAGQATEMAVDVPARSRQTVDLGTVPQLEGQTFSTRVDATQPVAVDRLVSLDAEGQSASLETAVSTASATWYFAEGSTVDPMELFYLVQNPGTTPASVQVRYLRPDGQAAVTRTYEVAAGSRATIWVDREDPALAATEVAAEITSIDGTPIVVERSLYLKQPGSAQPRGGDTSAGLTAPATRWFVEASTDAATTRLLLANPGSQAANVRATYRREDGREVVRSYRVQAGSRLTIDVAAQHPSLVDARLGITLEATQPIVAERSKWWGADGRLDEAVSGGGTTQGGARWLLAEAEQGGARQAATEVVVFNLGAATEVKVTLLFEDAPEVSATFPVAAGARFTVPMAEAFPGADGRRFSVLVEGAEATANLVVDRAIFWQGQGRAAAADGAAQRLR